MAKRRTRRTLKPPRRQISKRSSPAKTRRASSGAHVASGRDAAKKKPAPRRQLAPESVVPTPPSSLGHWPHASAAQTGRAELVQHLREHTETGPALTGGDIDANWESAYSSGDEAPGGDNPTPDQAIVQEIGRALGTEYQDNEELRAAEKITERDRHRWELDPASAEDYRERMKKTEK